MRRSRAASCPCHPTCDSRAPQWAASRRVRQAVPGRSPAAARVAYLDLAAAPPRPELGLADIGPAACLAGELSLLPGILASPAQAWTAPGTSWACHRSRQNNKRACMPGVSCQDVVRCCATALLPSSGWCSHKRGWRELAHVGSYLNRHGSVPHACHSPCRKERAAARAARAGGVPAAAGRRGAADRLRRRRCALRAAVRAAAAGGARCRAGARARARAARARAAPARRLPQPAAGCGGAARRARRRGRPAACRRRPHQWRGGRWGRRQLRACRAAKRRAGGGGVPVSEQPAACWRQPPDRGGQRGKQLGGRDWCTARRKGGSLLRRGGGGSRRRGGACGGGRACGGAVARSRDRRSVLGRAHTDGCRALGWIPDSSGGLLLCESRSVRHCRSETAYNERQQCSMHVERMREQCVLADEGSRGSVWGNRL